ncbi:uncharacterized protein DS421_14g476310 [Arachis hypogaea]|nr:uncharacterized protein DS421_14g476310 [Arachis hypogaea]
MHRGRKMLWPPLLLGFCRRHSIATVRSLVAIAVLLGVASIEVSHYHHRVVGAGASFGVGAAAWVAAVPATMMELLCLVISASFDFELLLPDIQAAAVAQKKIIDGAAAGPI